MTTASVASVHVLDGPSAGAEFDRQLANADEVHVAVAWATTSNPCHSALLSAAKKVRRLVVGLHFHQTDPEFIRSWRDQKNAPLALVLDMAGVFHPKIYLFRKGTAAAALVGSANFTHGGFSTNTEAMLLVEGKWGDPPFADLLQVIAEPRKEIVPTDAWLSAYSQAYRRRRTAARLLATTDDAMLEEETAFHELAVNFDTYCDLLTNADRDRPVLHAHSLNYEKWLDVLDGVGRTKGWPSTVSFKLEDWNKVLGVVQYPGGDRSVDFRLFGWTRPLQRNRLLSSGRAVRAIELIPATGPVTTKAWRAFVTEYCQEFNDTALTTASRLLALKRPDRFISANRRSTERLGRAAGTTVTTLDDYWNLHQVVWSWPWARAPRPARKRSARVWDARVALLDVLFYDPE